MDHLVLMKECQCLWERGSGTQGVGGGLYCTWNICLVIHLICGSFSPHSNSEKEEEGGGGEDEGEVGEDEGEVGEDEGEVGEEE